MPVKAVAKTSRHHEFHVCRHCGNTAPIGLVHLPVGPCHDIAEEPLNYIIHHLEIPWIEDDPSRIALPKANLLRLAETFHRS